MAVELYVFEEVLKVVVIERNPCAQACDVTAVGDLDDEGRVFIGGNELDATLGEDKSGIV